MHWQIVVFPLATVLLLVLIPFLERRSTRNRYVSDEENLAILARLRECSVYDLVHLSGKEWNRPKQLIEDDFKEYLQEGHLPYYVRDYIRKQRQELAHARQSDVLMQVGYPAFWCR